MNSTDRRINVTVTLVADLLCLLIMIIGLKRERDHALGSLLFNQSIIWVVLATLSQLPPTIFLWLDLNDAMNIMFQTPARPSARRECTAHSQTLSPMPHLAQSAQRRHRRLVLLQCTRSDQQLSLRFFRPQPPTTSTKQKPLDVWSENMQRCNVECLCKCKYVF
ncbi:hypothetical protein FA95DRAFT_1130626 [Auriscalpium vulgare]|uniref:Uncharacterized protein n=1 Tax=Auriscalpium vulgare TaxID=40419 RepID=A0ACB8RVX2_9AGAM|nr:hypothetical protein FA95DRAFT_1130626 [Auriscalpium vulgare]